MKKFITCLCSLAAIIVQVSLVQAAEVDVKWTNPDKYTDIDAGDEHRQHFKDRTLKAFEKHFAKLAESLPENQTLILDITDVDLAGDVNFGGIKRIRIIKDIYFPRMEFSYQLLNADKSIALSGDVSLKDMGFLASSRLKYRSQSLGHEKEMLDDWFKGTFADFVVK